MAPLAPLLALVVAALPAAAADSDSSWASALNDQGASIRKSVEAQKAVSAGTVAPPPAADSCDPRKFEGPAPDLDQPVSVGDPAGRLAGRRFPSIFQAWSPAENIDSVPFAGVVPVDNKWSGKTAAMHDVIWVGDGAFGLKSNGDCPGLSVGFAPSTIPNGLRKRAEILTANPNAVVLFAIHYYDASARYLPPDSDWWLKQGGSRADNSAKNPKKPTAYYKLDYHNPEFRAQVARQCKAALLSGVFDGCFFDWWTEDEDRLDLLKRTRALIGDEPLIVVNVNNRRPDRSASLINGMFMEGLGSFFWPADAHGWSVAQDNVQWAAKALRPPALPLLEGWFARSRSDLQDLKSMRALTTLVLTMSNGAALFGDPNDVGPQDHLHDWYPFWSKSLGKASGDGKKAADGTWRRDFDGGTAVFNPPGNPDATVTFSDGERTSAATHKRARTHSVPAGDGDLFLR